MVFVPAFKCSKLAKKTYQNKLNMFKVYNKDTRTSPNASISNFEHNSHFILL